MPIVVKYRNGQYELMAGETPKDWSYMNREGKILGTYLNGHPGIIYREDVRAVEFISDAEWKSTQEKAQKAKEEAEAKKAEDEAKRRAASDAAQLASRKRAANDAWARKPLLSRVFSKKPFPEIG